VVEPGFLKHSEGDVGAVAKVYRCHGATVLLDVLVIPGATVVIVARQLLEQLVVTDQLAEVVHENPGTLAVDQEHTEATVGLEYGLELANVGGGGNHDLAANRNGELDDLPELVRRAREDDETPGVGPLELGPDEPLDSVEVGAGRRLTVQTSACPPQEQVELLFHVPATGVPSTIDIEVAASHLGARGPELGQCSDLLLVDDGQEALSSVADPES
jgi:hypothetical protein